MVAKNAMHSSAGAEAGEAVGVPQLKFFSHSQIMPYFLSRKQACFSYEIACYTAIIYPLWKEKTLDIFYVFNGVHNNQFSTCR